MKYVALCVLSVLMLVGCASAKDARYSSESLRQSTDPQLWQSYFSAAVKAGAEDASSGKNRQVASNK